MRGSPFGKADGTNPLDGNQIPSGQAGAGYPCMGQPGRATELDRDRALRKLDEGVLGWGNAKVLSTSTERVGSATQRFVIEVRR